MTDANKDQKKISDTNNDKKKLSGANTLSLKGVDPNALKKNLEPGSNSGPVVEHKRRRRTTTPTTTKDMSGQRPHHKHRKPSDNKSRGNQTPKQSSGLSLSVAEIEARRKALSMASDHVSQLEEKRELQAKEQKELVEKIAASKNQPEGAVSTPDLSENDVSAKDLPLNDADKLNIAQTDTPSEERAKRKGPKILRQLKPEEYQNTSRSSATQSNNNKKPDTNAGTRNNNDKPSNNKTDNYANQRAQFSISDPNSQAAKGTARNSRSKSVSRDEMSEMAAQSKKTAAQPKQQRQRKLTITNASQADEVRNRSVASYRRRLDKQKKSQMQQDDRVKLYHEITLPDMITVQELANRMAERAADVIKELMKLGVMATFTQSIDADTAELIVHTMGHTAKRVSDTDIETMIQAYEDATETLTSRAPVVTIMGHVDHGKTSLLDALRKTNVVSGEAGGITQHIGAYQITLENQKKITFIDTPGHAAFSAMRARGARVTDIVILVVAADDGIMPQTIEAIKHAKAAEVPIIVAINKIDKPGADPEKIRAELLQHEIVVESMSGDVMDVEVSAKQEENLDGLLDTILLQAEMLELKANADRFAEGIVIEAELDKGRGAVATILVQHGQIKIGDIIVAGASLGRVRALINDLGERVEFAGPSVPVEILGLGEVPSAGDSFIVVENDARAREIAEYRAQKTKDKSSLTTVKSLENIMSQIKQSEVQTLPVVIKGDVQGSVEAIAASFAKIGNDEVKIQVVYASAGGITESDVNLAETAGAILIGFNVRANSQARELATKRMIEIRYYSIIYDVIDDLKQALSGMLSPELRENYLGKAEILEVFNITKVGNVAGCMIKEGLARRSAKVRLIRDNVVVHEGILSTLRRFKEEMPEIKHGYECGMAFENYHDIRVKDEIEIFEIQEIQRKLE